MQQCRSVYSEVLSDCGLQILHALHARVGDLPVVVVHRLADVLHDSVLDVFVESEVVTERCQSIGSRFVTLKTRLIIKAL